MMKQTSIRTKLLVCFGFVGVAAMTAAGLFSIQVRPSQERNAGGDRGLAPRGSINRRQIATGIRQHA